MHLNIALMLDALSGLKELMQARDGWAIPVRGRSPLGQSSRYLAIMTSLKMTSYGMIYDCSTHCSLFKWCLNFIAILLFVCPKLTCVESLISLHDAQHLLVDGFVTEAGNRHEICMRLRKRVKFEVWKTSLGFVKFHSTKLRSPPLHPPSAKSPHVLPRKWPLRCILYTLKIVQIE